jgi:AmiR/NasT family two-component response regulator
MTKKNAPRVVMLVDRILVAFDKETSRTRIAEMLDSGGMPVRAAFRSGAEVKREARNMGSAVVVCGFKLSDMTADDLAIDLDKPNLILVIAKPAQLEHCENEDIFKLAAPITKGDLLGTIRILLQLEEKYQRMAHPQRSVEEEELISMAKEILMRKNSLTEAQAHRLLQRRSMDTGSRMVETAKLIIESY